MKGKVRIAALPVFDMADYLDNDEAVPTHTHVLIRLVGCARRLA